MSQSPAAPSPAVTVIQPPAPPTTSQEVPRGLLFTGPTRPLPTSPMVETVVEERESPRTSNYGRPKSSTHLEPLPAKPKHATISSQASSSVPDIPRMTPQEEETERRMTKWKIYRELWKLLFEKIKDWNEGEPFPYEYIPWPGYHMRPGTIQKIELQPVIKFYRKVPLNYKNKTFYGNQLIDILGNEETAWGKLMDKERSIAAHRGRPETIAHNFKVMNTVLDITREYWQYASLLEAMYWRDGPESVFEAPWVAMIIPGAPLDHTTIRDFFTGRGWEYLPVFDPLTELSAWHLYLLYLRRFPNSCHEASYIESTTSQVIEVLKGMVENGIAKGDIKVERRWEPDNHMLLRALGMS